MTEPSIDEELVPKSEDLNGNQEILMDQVLWSLLSYFQWREIKSESERIWDKNEDDK